MSASPNNTNAPGDWRASVREVGPYLGLGLQLALSMAFFVGAGYALDYVLETLPWLTIAGSVVGMAAVFVQIFRTSGEIGRLGKSSKEEEASRAESKKKPS